MDLRLNRRLPPGKGRPAPRQDSPRAATRALRKAPRRSQEDMVPQRDIPGQTTPKRRTRWDRVSTDMLGRHGSRTFLYVVPRGLPPERRQPRAFWIRPGCPGPGDLRQRGQCRGRPHWRRKSGSGRIALQNLSGGQLCRCAAVPAGFIAGGAGRPDRPPRNRAK